MPRSPGSEKWIYADITNRCIGVVPAKALFKRRDCVATGVANIWASFQLTV